MVQKINIAIKKMTLNLNINFIQKLQIKKLNQDLKKEEKKIPQYGLTEFRNSNFFYIGGSFFFY